MWYIFDTGHKKVVTSEQEQDIVKLLNDGNPTLEVAKKAEQRTI